MINYRTSNVYAILNEKDPMIRKVVPFNTSYYSIITFCLKCNQWYCFNCDSRHIDDELHQKFIIYYNSKYGKKMKTFISNFCLQLCMHNYNNLRQQKNNKEKYNLEKHILQFNRVKKYIETKYPLLIRKVLHKADKDKYYYPNDYFNSLEINNNHKAKMKFIYDIYYLFSLFFNKCKRKYTQDFVLFQKLLQSVDFYELDEYNTIDKYNFQSIRNKIMNYFGLRNTQLTTITPIFEDFKIERATIFSSLILVYTNFSSFNRIIFHNLRNHSRCYLQLYYPHEENYSNWRIIQLENQIFIITLVSFLYFLQVNNNNSQSTCKIIKKISFKEKKPFIPILYKGNIYGLFCSTKGNIIFSMYSYPFNLIVEININCRSEEKQIYYWKTLTNKKLVAQVDERYLHIIDMNKKEDKEMCLHTDGIISIIKEITENVICILFNSTIVIIANINTCQIESVINDCELCPATIRDITLPTNYQALLKILYKESEEVDETTNLLVITENIGLDYYLLKYTKRIYTSTQINIINNKHNLLL